MATDWMETLALVRHGESESNVASRSARRQGQLIGWSGAGQADIVLTREGIRQAAETGNWLAENFVFDRVIVSPYRRTIQTAENICAKFTYNAKIRYDERIREKEVGILE